MRPATQAGVTVWTHALARRLLTTPDGTREVEAVEVERAGRTNPRRGARDRRLVRRRELGDPAAALRDSPAPTGACQFIGPGRAAVHGPPGHDDAGVPPVPSQRRGLPEDGGHQRLLPAGPWPVLPLEQMRIARWHATASWRRSWATRGSPATWQSIPEFGLRHWWLAAYDWLAISEDLPREANHVTLPRLGGRRRWTTSPTTFVAGRAASCARPRAILIGLGYWKVIAASHRANATQVRRAAGVGAQTRVLGVEHVLPHPRHRSLYIIDAPFLPSSAAIDPNSPIIQQALRIADRLRRTMHFSRRARSVDSQRPSSSRLKVQSFSHISVADVPASTTSSISRKRCWVSGSFSVSDAPQDRIRSFFGISLNATRRDARSGGFACRAARRSRFSASSRSFPPEQIPWNRIGQTHFSFEVRNIPTGGTTT